MMQTECPQCGKKFKPKYPKQIFCSPPCYWKAKKELKEIVCLGCGIHFPPTTAKTYFHTRQCFLQHRRKPEVIAERFWSYVIKTETCWNWTGDASESGYGVHSFRTIRTHHVRAHRWSWEPLPYNYKVEIKYYLIQLLKSDRKRRGDWQSHRVLPLSCNPFFAPSL